ncbi:MAG: hypothetical protein QM724_08805 [Flavobacteriales bacterium]
MRKILIALSIAGLVSTGQAQKKTDNAEVNWGPELNEKIDGDFVNIVDDNDHGIFQLVKFKKELHLQKMDMNMKVLYHKPLELEIDKKEYRLEKIHVLNDRILVFTSFYDKKQDQNNLYVKIYDESNFSPKGRMEKIGRITAGKQNNSGAFYAYVSPDQSKVLVRIVQPREKDVTKPMTVKVFDTEMQELWSKDIRLPEDHEVERFRMDDDGSVMVLTIKYAEKQERRERKRANKATYDYHLLVYHKDAEQPEDHKIAVGDKFLQDPHFVGGEGGRHHLRRPLRQQGLLHGARGVLPAPGPQDQGDRTRELQGILR